jgi:hypothetical protein
MTITTHEQEISYVVAPLATTATDDVMHFMRDSTGELRHPAHGTPLAQEDVLADATLQ